VEQQLLLLRRVCSPSAGLQGFRTPVAPVVLASSMRQLLPWTVLSVEGLRQPDGELVGDEVGAGLAAIRAMLIEDDGAGPVFSACRSGSVFIG
jgi:hypothetical protein